ncbi:MAG: hypothetical protein H7287_05450, partial [Thermoleophilia bacterium]|nr:hypothetical protein [Thermoleophilia bacterium]
IISQRLVKTADGRSRVPAVEVMVGTSRIADAILNPDETGTIQTALAEGSYYGMQSFDQSLLQLVLDGAVTVDEAMFHSSSKQNFALLLEANNVSMNRALRRSAAGSQAGDELGFELQRKGLGAVPVPSAPAAPPMQQQFAPAEFSQGALPVAGPAAGFVPTGYVATSADPHAPQPVVDPAAAAAAGFLPAISGAGMHPGGFPGVAVQQFAFPTQAYSTQAFQGAAPQQPRPQPGIEPDLPGHHAA